MNRGQILKRVNDFIQHPKGMFFVLLNNQIIILSLFLYSNVYPGYTITIKSLIATVGIPDWDSIQSALMS